MWCSPSSSSCNKDIGFVNPPLCAHNAYLICNSACGNCLTGATASDCAYCKTAAGFAWSQKTCVNSCPAGKFKYSGYCYTSCPTGSYQNTATTCLGIIFHLQNYSFI